MKPTKCPAIEKEMMQEKQKRRVEEKGESKSKTAVSEPKYHTTQVLNQIIYYWMVFLSFPCFIKFDCGAAASLLRLNEDKNDNGHKNSDYEKKSLYLTHSPLRHP